VTTSNFSEIPEGSMFHLPECCTTFYQKKGESAIRIKDEKIIRLQPLEKVFLRSCI